VQVHLFRNWGVFNLQQNFTTGISKLPGGNPSQCCLKWPPKAHLADSANLPEDLPHEGQNQIAGTIVRDDFFLRPIFRPI